MRLVEKNVYKRRVKALHNVLRFPDDGVSVEVSCGVKPEIELLLSIALALCEDVGVQNVRVAGKVSQELKVDLIMCWPLRRQLPLIFRR